MKSKKDNCNIRTLHTSACGQGSTLTPVSIAFIHPHKALLVCITPCHTLDTHRLVCSIHLCGEWQSRSRHCFTYCCTHLLCLLYMKLNIPILFNKSTWLILNSPGAEKWNKHVRRRLLWYTPLVWICLCAFPCVDSCFSSWQKWHVLAELLLFEQHKNTIPAQITEPFRGSQSNMPKRGVH